MHVHGLVNLIYLILVIYLNTLSGSPILTDFAKLSNKYMICVALQVMMMKRMIRRKTQRKAIPIIVLSYRSNMSVLENI